MLYKTLALTIQVLATVPLVKPKDTLSVPFTLCLRDSFKTLSLLRQNPCVPHWFMVLYFEDTSRTWPSLQGRHQNLQEHRLHGPCRWEAVHAVVCWCRLRSTPVSAGPAPCPTTRTCHCTKGSEVDTFVVAHATPASPASRRCQETEGDSATVG